MLEQDHHLGALACTQRSWAGADGQIVVLAVGGEIDALTNPRMRAAIDTALFGAVDQPTAHLVVDLTEISFCCVGGLRLLAETAVVAGAQTIGYTLCGCGGPLKRHWRIFGTLDPHATQVVVHPDRAAALAAIHTATGSCVGAQ